MILFLHNILPPFIGLLKLYSL